MDLDALLVELGLENIDFGEFFAQYLETLNGPYGYVAGGFFLILVVTILLRRKRRKALKKQDEGSEPAFAQKDASEESAVEREMRSSDPGFVSGEEEEVSEEKERPVEVGLPEPEEPEEEARPEVEVEEPEPEPEPEEIEEPKPKPKSLSEGLSKTKKGFMSRLGRALFGAKKIDDDLLEELEEILYTADIGAATSQKMFRAVIEKARSKELSDPAKVMELLKEEMLEILEPARGDWTLEDDKLKPQVILVVGVNGVGKTTTIGKLAHKYADRGHKVVLAAGDTFRAAAVEQLGIWGQRADVEVISAQEGADPSSVIYNGVQAARARKADLLIADTAGRLHTKYNLMAELKKIRRVCGKALERDPDEIWLVIDANTGQNAINQARKFNEELDLTGLIVTKLDGTAKGGVIFGITDELRLPIHFIGIGEALEDLRRFDPQEFVEALF